MEEAEKKKYAKMFFMMTTDYLMDAITWETYLTNAEIAIKKMTEKCETCEYKVNAPHDGFWCYMFENKMDNCKKYL